MRHRLLVSLLLSATAASLVSGCVGYVPAGPGYGGRPEYRNDDRGYRDRDRDGISNRRDRDRDGDGVRNRDDRRPDNPNRY